MSSVTDNINSAIEKANNQSFVVIGNKNKSTVRVSRNSRKSREEKTVTYKNKRANDLSRALSAAVRQKIAEKEGCDVNKIKVSDEAIAGSIAQVAVENKIDLSKVSTDIKHVAPVVTRKQIRQDRKNKNMAKQKSNYDLLTLTTELEMIFAKQYDLKPKTQDEKFSKEQKQYCFESGEQQKQNEIIKLLSDIPAITNWLTIVKAVLYLCSISCPEFVDPKTTMLSAVDNANIIKGGFGEKAKPLTVIKLIIHNYKSLFATAINSASTSRKRLSIQQLIKNVYVTPPIFNGDDMRTFINWYLHISTYTSCFAKHYKYQ